MAESGNFHLHFNLKLIWCKVGGKFRRIFLHLKRKCKPFNRFGVKKVDEE